MIRIEHVSQPILAGALLLSLSLPTASAQPTSENAPADGVGEYSTQLADVLRTCTAMEETPEVDRMSLLPCCREGQAALQFVCARCRRNTDGTAMVNAKMEGDRLLVTGENGPFEDIEGPYLNSATMEEEPTTFSTNRRFALVFESDVFDDRRGHSTSFGNIESTIIDDGVSMLDLRISGRAHRLVLDHVNAAGTLRSRRELGAGAPATAFSDYANYGNRGVAALPRGLSVVHFFARGGRTPGGSSLMVTTQEGGALVDDREMAENHDLRRITGVTTLADGTILVAGAARRHHPVEECYERIRPHSFQRDWCFEPVPRVVAMDFQGEVSWSYTPEAWAGEVVGIEPLESGGFAVAVHVDDDGQNVQTPPEDIPEGGDYVDIISDDGEHQHRFELTGAPIEITTASNGEFEMIAVLEQTESPDATPRLVAYDREGTELWTHSVGGASDWARPTIVGLSTGEIVLFGARPAGDRERRFTPATIVFDADGSSCSSFDAPGE